MSEMYFGNQNPASFSATFCSIIQASRAEKFGHYAAAVTSRFANISCW